MTRAGLVLTLLACAATGAAQLSPALTAKVDEIAAKELTDSAAPSVSIAIVQNGKISFEKAYGKARLDPATDARSEMRYSIGSVSKQFLAGCVLLLVQQGKMSLDDRVERYLPDLTEANEVTIRQLLTHTSGYRDYYPQDYLAPFMRKPVTPDEILDEWAKKPLDFEPGTRWQYSNTNFVIAARIIEKATGTAFFDYLSKHILEPLGMTTAINLADRTLTPRDAAGYTRFALGPPRPVPPEGPGWLFGAGELAMTAHDLALWDISLIDRKLLTSASIEMLTTPVRLRNGTPTNYALGIGVYDADGHPRWQHSGGVSGFVSRNTVWPDQRAAVVVFANEDGSEAPTSITNQIAPLILAEGDPGAAPALTQARQIFEGLLEGKIDRTLLTPDADSFFNRQVLDDAAASLKARGPLVSLKQTGVELRGGMTYRHFELKFKDKTLLLNTLTTPVGKLEQYLIQ